MAPEDIKSIAVGDPKEEASAADVPGHVGDMLS